MFKLSLYLISFLSLRFSRLVNTVLSSAGNGLVTVLEFVNLESEGKPPVAGHLWILSLTICALNVVCCYS